MSDQHIRRTHKVSTDKTADNTADLEHLTNSRNHGTSEPVPEADLLEQLTPVDPAVDPADIPAADGPIWAAGQNASQPNRPVDEADWLEQQLAVPAIEEAEDYPPDLGGSLDHPGFSAR